jgi:hypothetical protein
MISKTNSVIKHEDITRIDQESKRTHGWNVRIRFHGKMQSKFFADEKNGGENSALLAAITWRNSTRDKLGKPQTDRHVVTMSKNPTGVVGVSLSEKLHCYEVSWTNPDGQQGRTSVSIIKHGKQGAFKRACKIRNQKEVERLEAD